LPDRLKELLEQSLATGEAKWTALAMAAIRNGAHSDDVLGQLPWLMTEMTKHGSIDSNERTWMAVADGIRIEELRITTR